MTESDLDRIGSRASLATPGPWVYDGMHREIVTPKNAESYWLIISECRAAPDHPFSAANICEHLDLPLPNLRQRLLAGVTAPRRRAAA